MYSPKSAPEKHCEQCGTMMDRKRFNGRIEDMAVFMRRRFCGLTCSGGAHRKPRVTAVEKYCNGCKTTKSSDQFGALKGGADGLRWRCRSCESASTQRWQACNQDVLKAYRKTHHQANRDRLNSKRKQHYQQNVEHEIQTRRLWRERNPGAASAASMAWARANPDKYAANMRQRRARMVGAAGVATAEQIAARVAFYGWSCWMCGGPYEHLDHVIPLARGGTNWPANLRPACKPCNLKKGSRLWSPTRPKPPSAASGSERSVSGHEEAS